MGLLGKILKGVVGVGKGKVLLVVAGVIFGLGLFIGLAFPREKSGNEVLSKLQQELGGEVKLPEVMFEKELGLGSGTSKGLSLNSEATESAKLQVLSANLIGIWETKKTQKPQDFAKPQTATAEAEATKSATSTEKPSPTSLPQAKLKGIRILGEVKNIGGKKVENARVMIRFYSKKKKLLAVKVGSWNKSYIFLPLEPGEVNVYDVLLPNPPQSESVSIEMTPNPSDKASGSRQESFETIKIKDKKLEKAELEKSGQKISYYKFSGALVNIADGEVVNPGIYVWLKNEKGKVIGLTTKIFETDLLTSGQELEANLLIAPLSKEEVFTYEIRTFGEKL